MDNYYTSWQIQIKRSSNISQGIMENVFVNVRHADIHIDDAGAFSKDYKKGIKLLDKKLF